MWSRGGDGQQEPWEGSSRRNLSDVTSMESSGFVGKQRRERRISIPVCFDTLSVMVRLSTVVEGLPVASPILSCPGTSVYPNGLLRNSPLSPQATHSEQPYHWPSSPTLTPSCPALLTST